MKKMILSFGLLLTAAGAFAQKGAPTIIIEESPDKFSVQTKSFWSNWFITAGGGAQMYFGDHNRQLPLSKQITPSINVGLGKWITPVTGMRLMYSGYSIKGATQNLSHSTGEIFDASKALYYQKFNYSNLHADAMFNLTNLLFGYNAQRVYSITPYAGLGLMFTNNDNKDFSLSGHLGLINTFHLSPVIDLNIEISGAMVNDGFDGERGRAKFEGILSGDIGVTYKFGNRGWERSKTIREVYYNKEELNEMRRRINIAEENLTKSLEEQKRLKNLLDEAPKITEVHSIKIPKQITVFALGKSVLSSDARVNLGFYSRILLSNTDKVYSITGYADNSTGTVEANDRISRARAQAVYDCLVNEFKIPASILTIHSMGGVADMFYDSPALSRSTIIEVIDKE